MESGHAPATGPDPSRPASRWGTVRATAFGSDSYGLVFLLLIGDYVLLTVGWTGRLALVVGAVWFALTVLLTFHTSRVPRRLLDVVRVVVAATVLTTVAVALGGGSQAYGAVLSLMALLILACPFAIGWRIAHHARVTAQTILGALSIYVLIGLIFANADYALQLVSGNSFFAQSGHHGPSDFVYYSYITMATVGYGDLTPATGLPRTYAVSEALTGQIFLVVLVARLVSLYAPTHGWRGEIREDAAEAAPPRPEAPEG